MDMFLTPRGLPVLPSTALWKASLKPGDVVILGTPPAFRWVMFSYAIDKGLHCFMERSLESST